MKNTSTAIKTPQKRKTDVRRLVFTALMGALSIVLSETLKFKLPIMPSFIDFDFSDVPAVLAALTMGPISGLCVALIKNLEGLFTSGTGGVGELSNLILSSCLVIPAGIAAKKSHKYGWVIFGSVCGAVVMAGASILSNYFIVYPIYTKFMPMEAIISAYQSILPSVDNLLECLVVFNMPFTFVKGMTAVIISVPLYKKLRPIFNSMGYEADRR
ncbi:MAG: ECF transporter S component [Oscillospiraceae bacterium]